LTPISPAGFANPPEDVPPWIAGAWIALETCERLVQRLPFDGCGYAALEQVRFVEFSESGKDLGSVTGSQLGQFFEDLRFAHGMNLAR
jgi:hypothetical protein